MLDCDDDFVILGVTSKVTPDELRRNYRQRCLQLHPDKIGTSDASVRAFHKMKDAYEGPRGGGWGDVRG